MSKLYSIHKVQNIPATVAEVWDFISSPKNLKEITPPEMGLKITSEITFEKIHAGQIIAYTLTPIIGIKLKWVTEITQMQENKYFVDEQRFGPYSFWHHQHFIKPIEGGTEMLDIVHYKIPFGFMGDMANSILVKPQLKKVFDFRFKKIEEKFGSFS
ncbi:MAG: SRPBCC family protein [Bacteroidetes bacterium]|nr:SRPBCC family protein [Bacteroidota bacterium]